MAGIVSRLARVRKDLARLLDRTVVERICKTLKHTWRKRQLDPWEALHLCLLQVLHQNTAMTHLPHLSGMRFSAAAFCQARQRLPLELFVRLDRAVAAQASRNTTEHRWEGHRLVLADGTTFSMSDTAELRAHFGLPPGQKPGCGFPVAHLLLMLDAATGFIRDAAVGPLATHDMAQVAQLHPQLVPGDILVADRGFCSYAHLALLLSRFMHAVFRLHQRQIVDFRPHRPAAGEVPGTGLPRSRWVKSLGYCDQLVKWLKPESRPDWMSAEAFAATPAEILVREIRRKIAEPGCRVREVTLVTTLLDPVRYPAEAIVALYGRRWQIEVDIRDLKTTLNMDVLKGQKVATVYKEMRSFFMVYNLVRAVMAEAAQRQHVHPQRISFIDALRWLQPSKPDGDLHRLVVNPARPGRVEPRCRKRRPKNSKLMTKPRAELRKRLKKRAKDG